MVLQSVATNKDGKTVLTTDKVIDFGKMVVKPHDLIYDERIVYDDIKIDSNLASV